MSYTSKAKFTLFTLSFALALSAFTYLQPIDVQAQGSDLRDSSSAVQATSTGLITGELSFPSEHIPALTIFATRIDNGKNTYYSIQTADGQSSYALRVDPGVYQVVAYAGDYAGGYTEYVACGLEINCGDHSLLPVLVQAGDILDDITPGDWYAPSGAFLPRPDGPSYPQADPTCQTYHTVQRGESLFWVGLQYNLTWIPIAKANNISNANLIYAGQVLCIPAKASSSFSTSSSSGRSAQIPTIQILSVVRNKRATIQTDNFPANTSFVVTMGRYGTKGINGIEVATTQSGSGGSFNATYSIPYALRDQDRIAIRLQSAAGYYSYNWFYNNSTN